MSRCLWARLVALDASLDYLAIYVSNMRERWDAMDAQLNDVDVVLMEEESGAE